MAADIKIRLHIGIRGDILKDRIKSEESKEEKNHDFTVIRIDSK